MNKYGGVIGAFNCQGAGWCKLDKKYVIHDSTPDAVSGSIRGSDIEGLGEVASQDWNGDCVVLRHRTQELIQIPRHVAMPITLQSVEYELLTVVPVENLDSDLSLAPIGLIEMFNSGGAMAVLNYNKQERNVSMQVDGCGIFGVFATQQPHACVVDSVETPYTYDQNSGLLSVPLPKPNEGHLWTLNVQF